MAQALQPGMRVTLAVGAEPRTQTGDDGADVLEAEVQELHPRYHPAPTRWHCVARGLPPSLRLGAKYTTSADGQAAHRQQPQRAQEERD